MQCTYCSNWRQSPIVKKTRTKIFKYCKTIKSDTCQDNKVCKRIKSTGNFLCDVNGIFLNIDMCLNRRKLIAENKKKYSKIFTGCKLACRQFKTEIEPLIEYMDSKTIKIPRRNNIQIKRRIKRR